MPRPKKRRASSDADGSEGPASSPVAKPAKKTKTSYVPDGTDDEGNPFWELSSKRRIGISHFRNACLVNGISLSVSQYVALIKAAPAINAALQDLGQKIDGLESTIEPPAKASPKPDKAKNKPCKANIEATSDEDEG
ncbi:hypothetical protein CDD81_7229 [Ophiocordyceps australis]|uniref:Transcriptional coactivator p15 (PC4) C-terminal domain-containing protein n=1 Tax=Ophiocordyceps australis TaxID=1399860 RepID=A0A2C5Y105_9HYPO|nr:hypothetical protein CDD81_7229 [Ophiocordyceps australis]